MGKKTIVVDCDTVDCYDEHEHEVDCEHDDIDYSSINANDIISVDWTDGRFWVELEFDCDDCNETIKYEGELNTT